MMVVALWLLYLSACTVLAWYGIRALFHMTRRTHHLRRVAFLALTVGPGAAVLEAIGQHPPLLSAVSIAAGAGLLLMIGARGIRL